MKEADGEVSVDDSETSEQPVLESLRHRQLSDPDLREIYALKLTGSARPGVEQTVAWSGKSKAYIQQWDQIVLENQQLYRLFEDSARGAVVKQLVVPREDRREILEAIYAGFGGGHFGIRKTLARLQKYYRVDWTTDVRDFCRGCASCATYHRGPVPRQGHLAELRVGEPMERWGIDITGPHPTSSAGHRYILTAIDYFTR